MNNQVLIAYAAIAIVGILFGIAIPIYFIPVFVSAFSGVPSSWLGDKPIAEYGLGGLQLAAIVFGAFIAWRGYYLNKRIALSTRFQNAVQLLGSGSPSTQLGGIALLPSLIVDDPKTYTGPVLRILGQSVREKNSEEVDAIYKLTAKDKEPGDLPRSSPQAINALRGIGGIKSFLRWKTDSVLRQPYFDVTGLYLNDYEIRDRDFRGVRFRRTVVIDHVRFVRCHFGGRSSALREAIPDLPTFSVRIAGKVSFEDCTFDNVTISAHNLCGLTVEPDDHFEALEDCAGLLTINGKVCGRRGLPPRP